MSGKLLNEISEENQDLQRRVGCMMGIFQMLDRHRLLSGRRLSRKRLPAGGWRIAAPPLLLPTPFPPRSSPLLPHLPSPGGGAAAGDHLRAEERHQASPRIVLVWISPLREGQNLSGVINHRTNSCCRRRRI